jgi:hypothetical protein
MNIYYDSEFTGLHQKTTLISFALISQDKQQFYCELTDYDKSQLDDWLNENVIANLTLQKMKPNTSKFVENKNQTLVYGDMGFLKIELEKWLKQFDKVEIVSDCLSYDWVLFNEIFGGAMNIPENVFYIPIELCTMFTDRDIDPDISREEFAFDGKDVSNKKKHNALWDAFVIKKCYEKLKQIK